MGLDYSDKKSEVYMLKREISPLPVDEGASVAFVIHEGGGMLLFAVTLSGKGKPALEFKAWDMMGSLGFTAKELTVQDSQKMTVNETKFRAVVSLPETVGVQHSLKIDSFKDFIAVSSGTGLVFLWKCKKVDMCIILELQVVVKANVPVQDIALILADSGNKKGCAALLVGEPGGVKMFTPAKIDGPLAESTSVEQELKFVASHIQFPPADVGSTVQEIRRSSPSSCVLSDSTGQLWLLTPPRIDEIILPSSRGGHGLFAVQYHHGKTDGWLATIEKGQTVNLYKLNDLIKNSESGLISQPWHVFFSGSTLSSICFMEDNVLAAGSHTNRTISLWVGLDTIGA